MVIKYCFQGEIHKTFTPPQTFVALLDEISSIFEEKLPSLFTLQYKDAEGDIITISSDTEYQSILKYELTRGAPSIKIFVLPNKKANSSFEVVSDTASNCSSHSVIERGASEISLSEASEGKITPRSRSKSPSSCSDSCSESSVQEERVTLPQKINLSQTQEEPTEEDDIHDETLARLEARAATLKEQIELFYAMADNIENVLQRDQFENSLERAISELESLNGKTPELQQASISQYQSVENSVLSKEIDEAVEEMTARKLRNIIRRIMALDVQHTEEDIDEEEEDLPSASEPSDMYENRPQALINLLNIRRRQAKTIKNQAALMIQNAYRGYRLRKMLNNYVQPKPFYLDTENERQLKLTRTKEQISKLIQNTLNHQLADRLQVYKNLRLDCLSEDEQEEVQDHNSSIYDDEEENWKLENIQTRDCRESSPSDNGTIFNDEDESADHEVSERKCRQCQDFEYCEHCESFSKPDDDYVRCRLELEDDIDSRYEDQEESLQTPDTNLINRVYEEIMQLEAREVQVQTQPQGHFDFLVVNDMKSNVLVFSSNEGKKLVYKTICIENTGTKAWRKCYIKSMGQFEARTQEIYNVGVGQVIVITLEFNDYFYAGPYSSQWKLIHETENGVMEVIGKPFDVDFIIQWREPFNDSFLFKEENQPIEEVEDYIYHNIRDDEEEEDYSEGRQGEENMYEEKNDTIYEDKREEEESSRQDDYTGDVDVTFAKYINYREELARVREIRKIFPEDDLDDIVEFVEQNDEMPMDKLLVTYIRSRNPFGVQDF